MILSERMEKARSLLARVFATVAASIFYAFLIGAIPRFVLGWSEHDSEVYVIVPSILVIAAILWKILPEM